MTSPIWHSSFAYCLARCTRISCSLHSSFNNTLGQGFRSPNVSYSCQLLITTVLASYKCSFGMHLLPIPLRVPHLYLAFARFVQQPTRFRLQFTQRSLHLSAARHKRPCFLQTLVENSAFACCIVYSTPIPCFLHSSFGNPPGSGFNSPNVLYFRQPPPSPSRVTNRPHPLQLLIRLFSNILGLSFSSPNISHFSQLVAKTALAIYNCQLCTYVLPITSPVPHIHLAHCIAYLAILLCLCSSLPTVIHCSQLSQATMILASVRLSSYFSDSKLLQQPLPVIISSLAPLSHLIYQLGHVLHNIIHFRQLSQNPKAFDSYNCLVALFGICLMWAPVYATSYISASCPRLQKPSDATTARLVLLQRMFHRFFRAYALLIT